MRYPFPRKVDTVTVVWVKFANCPEQIRHLVAWLAQVLRQLNASHPGNANTSSLAAQCHDSFI